MANPAVDDWQDEGADDWEEAPKAAVAPRPGPSSSTGGAALRGFGQGVTADFGDELGAGLQAGLQGLSNALPEGALEWADIDNRYAQDAGDVYRQARTENRAQLRQDMAEHPVASTLGNVGGSVVLGGIAPGAGTYGQAAALGAASGLGASEYDLTDPTARNVGGAVADTLTGTALGVAGQYIGEQAGRAIPALARRGQQALTETAQEKALKAAGYIQKDLKPMIRRDPASVARQGQVLLEERGLITPGATVEDISGRIGSSLDAYGDQIGRARREADALGATFDMEPFLQKVEQDILAPIAGDPAVRREANELRRLISGYRQLAAQRGGIGFEEAANLKTRLEKTINFGNAWNTGGPAENAERFVKALDSNFASELYRQLDQVLEPGAFASYRDAMARYGPLKEALDKSRQGIAREGGNASFGLRDYLAGAAGSIFGPAGAIVAPVVNKVLRQRGDSAIARGAYGLARSGGIEALARANPEAFGRWAGPVAAALARGPAALQALDKVLRDTSPEWRQMRQQQDQQAAQQAIQ